MCEDSLASDIEWPVDSIKKQIEPEGSIWVTRDGRVLEIKDMTDNHIDNIIKFLDRRVKYLERWKQRMIAEKNYRLPWWRYIWETLC